MENESIHEFGLDELIGNYLLEENQLHSLMYYDLIVRKVAKTMLEAKGQNSRDFLKGINSDIKQHSQAKSFYLDVAVRMAESAKTIINKDSR